MFTTLGSTMLFHKRVAEHRIRSGRITSNTSVGGSRESSLTLPHRMPRRRGLGTTGMGTAGKGSKLYLLVSHALRSSALEAGCQAVLF